MNIFADIKDQLIGILQTLQAEGELPHELEELDFARITVEPPRDAAHGDMATNAAMVLASLTGLKTRDLAAMLTERLAMVEGVEAAEIAGPGFVNLRLAPSQWQALVPAVLAAGPAFGTTAQTHKDPINIEYVSANPTGPIHVGHARGAVFGDALARLLEKNGYRVLREYYVNDAGSQIDILARSALMRMREASGEDIGEIPPDFYPGDYLKPVGMALIKQYGAGLLLAEEGEQLASAKKVAVPMMMQIIRDDLAALGVNHAHFLSEQSLQDDGSVDDVFDQLKAKGFIYRGVLEPPKGKARPPDWEPNPQWLFKSVQFGDDNDRAMMKSDGSWTYFAPDIACHYNKYKRGYTQMINIWGADHVGYIKRMQSAVAAITGNEATLEVKTCNLVKLQRDGKPIKMSKRSGNFITLREVVDEVGKDVVRFMMLTRKNDAPLDFDFNLVKQKSRDNPVFYVQYAHARICSVMRLATQQAGLPTDAITDAALQTVDLSPLKNEAELALMRLLAAYPRVIQAAADAREPHRIAFYVQDVAAAFHALWNLGKERPELRFIIDGNIALSYARLAMIRATAVVIACGLDVIGVEPETEMR